MTTAVETPAPAPAAPRKSRAAKAAERNAQNATDVPSASVEAPEAAPTADSRYPAPKVAQEVARRVKAARDLGFSRTRLEELVEAEGGNMTPANLWRAEQGRVHVAELAYLEPVLDKIDSGKIELPAKPVKDPKALQAKVDATLELLRGHGDVKGVNNLRDLITQALETLAA